MRNIRSLALAGAVFLTPGLQAEPLEIGGPPYSSPSETSLRFAVLDTGSDIPVKEMNNRGDFVGGNQRWVGTNASYQTLSPGSEYEFAYVADLSEDGTAVGRVTVNHIVGEGEGAWSWTEERGALWLPDSTDPVILQTPGVHIDFPDGSLTYLSAFARTIDGTTIYGMGDHVWFQAGNSIHGQEAFAWGYAGLMWDVDESLTAPATQYDDWVCAGYGYYYNNLIEVIKARGEHTIDYWYWSSELIPQPPNGYYWESDQSYRVDQQRVSYYPMDINAFGAHIANSSAGWLPREQGQGVDFLQRGQARMPLPRLGTGTVALNSRRETNQAGVLCDFFQVVGNPVGGPILAEPEFAGGTNYVTHTLNKLVPTNWPVHYVYDINDHGVIAAAAHRQGASNPTTVLLLPVQITEVSFNGTKYHELWADDCGATDASQVPADKKYSGPQWKDVDGNGKPTNTAQGERDYAVAFTRNTKPKIGAKFKIASASNFGAIKIKATGPGGVTIPETVATVSGDVVILPNDTEASAALVNTIKFYDKKDDAKAFKLEWEVKIGASDWSKIGTTKHTVYVLLADPITSLRQETLADLGCRNANEENAEASARVKMYEEFTDRVVKRLDGKQMSYWLNDQQGATATADLLSGSDGNGNCESWSGLFRDVLRLQGIQADRIKVWPQSNDGFVAVKTWTFTEPPHGPVNHPYVIGRDATDAHGVPGQGNPNPPGAFNGHWITESGGAYFDPSYGAAAASGANRGKLYEDGAFAGFGATYEIPNNGGQFDGIRKNDTSAQSPAEVDYSEAN